MDKIKEILQTKFADEFSYFKTQEGMKKFTEKFNSLLLME